jgi:protein ImuB
VLYAAGGRSGQTVVARSRRAAAQGVRPGMPLAQARALLEQASPSPKYERFDPPTPRAALQALAEWCVQFSPLVGIEEADTPECLLLDIAGCDHLFGGESAMAERVVGAFAGRGLVARVAIADTSGAAWAVAHYGRQTTALLPPGQHIQALQPLPVEALRIPPAAAVKLRQLDIRTIAQLQALPRESLPSRFGLEILRRLDQALGHRPEPIRPVTPLPPVEISQNFLYPTADRWILEVALRTLVEELIAAVRQKGQGIQELLCRFLGERREEMQFTVRLLQATQSAARLFELVRLRLDAARQTGEKGDNLLVPKLQFGNEKKVRVPFFAGDVCDIHLKAEVAVVEVDHYSLFEGVDLLDRRSELMQLIERLSSRLGPRAVTRPQWSLNPQPELVIAYTSALGEEEKDSRLLSAGRGARRQNPQSPRMVIRGNATSREKAQRIKKDAAIPRDRVPAYSRVRGLYLLPNPQTLTAPFRPPRLTREPVAVEVMSLVPDGPPIRLFWQGHAHQIGRCWGPERIETGWWLGRHTRRDYYRVETTRGPRFWLFRERTDGRWFLHGFFT